MSPCRNSNPPTTFLLFAYLKRISMQYTTFKRTISEFLTYILGEKTREMGAKANIMVDAKYILVYIGFPLDLHCSTKMSYCRLHTVGRI